MVRPCLLLLLLLLWGLSRRLGPACRQAGCPLLLLLSVAARCPQKQTQNGPARTRMRTVRALMVAVDLRHGSHPPAGWAVLRLFPSGSNRGKLVTPPGGTRADEDRVKPPEPTLNAEHAAAMRNVPQVFLRQSPKATASGDKAFPKGPVRAGYGGRLELRNWNCGYAARSQHIAAKLSTMNRSILILRRAGSDMITSKGNRVRITPSMYSRSPAARRGFPRGFAKKINWVRCLVTG